MCLRQGALEAPRIGDRFLSPSSKQFRRGVTECLVETIRSAIQVGFYACDYSTKPNAQCGPVLSHLRDGMEALDQELEEAAERERLDDLRATGTLHSSDNVAQEEHDQPNPLQATTHLQVQ